MTALRIAPLLIGLAALAGCENRSKSGLSIVKVDLGGTRFSLEVADNDSTRSYGLMRRDSLDPDAGMLFVFAQEEPRSFWMKNTRIPLDIIYLDRGGRIVSIRQMQPYVLDGVPSNFPAMYAIEINQGRSAQLGLKDGQTIQLPAGLKGQ